MKNIFYLRSTPTKYTHGVSAKRGSCGPCILPTEPGYVPPPLYLQTPINLKLGGIAGWVALHCSVGDLTDYTDPLEWQALIDAGLIFGRVDKCHIRGSKPAATPDTVETGACGAIKETTITDVYTLTDVGEDDELSVSALYCWLTANKDQYKFATITCDGRLRAFKTMTLATFVDFEPETNAEFFGHTITFNVQRPAKECCPIYNVPFVHDLDLRTIPPAP